MRLAHMIKHKLSILHVIVFTFFLPTLCFAQSVMVIADVEAAQRCYHDATKVTTIENFIVRDEMIFSCNVALDQYGLVDKDRAATFANRGILYAAQGSLAEALSDYDEALDLHPVLGEAYISRGIIFHFEKQFEKAIADYSRAIELESRDIHLAYFDRGMAYEELHRWEDALLDYQKALEFHPDWTPAVSRLHWVKDKLDSENLLNR
tara:strand:+ start:1874 stop:2494 length:621 start_codon:yes stop_codon:yes gene_type:complete